MRLWLVHYNTSSQAAQAGQSTANTWWMEKQNIQGNETPNAAQGPKIKEAVHWAGGHR